ncbi:MAG TPA: hypothetical protein VIM44_08015 [Rariglobus sp.]
MSRAELKALVDSCSSTDRRYLLAYLRTKDPAYRRKLTEADREIEAGRSVRLRIPRRTGRSPSRAVA